MAGWLCGDDNDHWSKQEHIVIRSTLTFLANQLYFTSTLQCSDCMRYNSGWNNWFGVSRILPLSVQYNNNQFTNKALWNTACTAIEDETYWGCDVNIFQASKQVDIVNSHSDKLSSSIASHLKNWAKTHHRESAPCVLGQGSGQVFLCPVGKNFKSVRNWRP